LLFEYGCHPVNGIALAYPSWIEFYSRPRERDRAAVGIEPNVPIS
jgi:hypothetical protein